MAGEGGLGWALFHAQPSWMGSFWPPECQEALPVIPPGPLPLLGLEFFICLSALPGWCELSMSQC